MVYRFLDVEVDSASFSARRHGVAAEIEPKALEVLLFMLRNRGRLVQKGELLDAVWHGANVTENVLSREIAALRRALGDDARSASIIQTVHGRGYRFIASASEYEVAPAAIAALPTATTVHPRWRRNAAFATLALVFAGTLAWWALFTPRSAAAVYRPTPAAQQEFQAGQYFMNAGTRDALDKAVQHFNVAVQRDAKFALAYASLADAYSRYERYGSRASDY